MITDIYDPDDELSFNRIAMETQQIVGKILKGAIEKCDIISVRDKVHYSIRVI